MCENIVQQFESVSETVTARNLGSTPYYQLVTITATRPLGHVSINRKWSVK